MADGRLVYADSKFNLTVRDTATGKQLWSKKVGDDWQWTPVVHHGLVFLPGKELQALDINTGDLRWKLFPNGRRGVGNPTDIDGLLYVPDHERGVWVLDPKTGAKREFWEAPGLRSNADAFLRVGDNVYGTSALTGALFALDTKSGKVRWTFEDDADTIAPSMVTASGNRLLVTHGPEIYAFPAV